MLPVKHGRPPLHALERTEGEALQQDVTVRVETAVIPHHADGAEPAADCQSREVVRREPVVAGNERRVHGNHIRPVAAHGLSAWRDRGQLQAMPWGEGDVIPGPGPAAHALEEEEVGGPVVLVADVHAASPEADRGIRSLVLAASAGRDRHGEIWLCGGEGAAGNPLLYPLPSQVAP